MAADSSGRYQSLRKAHVDQIALSPFGRRSASEEVKTASRKGDDVFQVRDWKGRWQMSFAVGATTAHDRTDPQGNFFFEFRIVD